MGWVGQQWEFPPPKNVYKDFGRRASEMTPLSNPRQIARRIRAPESVFILDLFKICSLNYLGSVCQAACKPGSVPDRNREMIIPLGRPLPGDSRDPPGRRRGNAWRTSRHAAPIRSCSRRGLPCRPRCRRRGALLPHPFTLAAGARSRPGAGLAVCFLWHCPWGRPRRALPGAVFPWSPDFPPAGRLGKPVSQRSSGRLTQMDPTPGRPASPDARAAPWSHHRRSR